MVIFVDWTLIVLPVIAVVVVCFVIVLIVYLKKLTSFDIHRSRDGYAYKIVDL